MLARLPAGKASNALFAVPVVALLLGWLVLEEVASPLAVVSGALALLGVAISRRGSS